MDTMAFQHLSWNANLKSRVLDPSKVPPSTVIQPQIYKISFDLGQFLELVTAGSGPPLTSGHGTLWVDIIVR